MLAKIIFSETDRQDRLREAFEAGHVTMQELEAELSYSLSVMLQAAYHDGLETDADGWMRWGELCE